MEGEERGGGGEGRGVVDKWCAVPVKQANLPGHLAPSDYNPTV